MRAMERKINFNAGPAELPGEVLHEVAKATLKYKKTGLSILELPHRSPEFNDILEESKQLVHELCGLGKDHSVVWLHGGGRLQFCMVPMNFLPPGKTAAYIDSGQWAREAGEYAAYYGATKVVATSSGTNYSKLPQWPGKLPPKTAYLHLTTNNTIYGTQWRNIPPAGVPLIADMSSDIFGQARDYTQYDMFYATAQKNLGSAGVALAVISNKLLQTASATVPPMLSYAHQVKQNSVVNTANVAGIYTSLLMLRWTKNQGIANIEQQNMQKADALYDHLDQSQHFVARVTEKDHRSRMNVCFTAREKAVGDRLLALCDKYGITGIEGHRSTGGFRVSLYNAIPFSAVQLLLSVMDDLERSL